MGLRMIERILNVELSQEQVDEIFATWMETIPSSRQFYAHSDELSLYPMLDKMGLPHNMDMRYLTPEQQEICLPLLTIPEFVGCGHFRFGLMHPDLYGLSQSLPRHFIRTVYKYMWNGEHKSKIKYVVLPGVHNEAAVVVVKQVSLPSDCSVAPQIAPDTGASSVFLAYADLVHIGIRNRVVNFIRSQLSDRFGLQTAPSAVEVTQEIDKMAAVQQAQTVPRLAGTLPIYTLSLSFSSSYSSVSSTSSTCTHTHTHSQQSSPHRSSSPASSIV